MSRYPLARDFAILTLLWGTVFPAVEFGLSTFPPLLLMALRFDVAALVMISYIVLTADNWWPTTRGDALAIVAGAVLWTAIGNGVWYAGQNLTTSVFSGLTTSFVPILTAGFSWILLREERLSLVSSVGLGVAFVGALLMMVPSGTIAFTDDVLGKVILFGGAVGVALSTVLIRYADTSLSSPVQTAWSVALGAVILHILSPLSGEQWNGDFSLTAALVILYLGVLSTVFAYLLYFSLLKRRPAIELTLILYLVPVVAAVPGWFLFGEPITPNMVVGFLVVVTGFSLMKRQELRAEFSRRI